MGFGIGLGAGLRALSAARLGIETAGQNVANANTPGYSRQRIVLASTMPFSIGRGLQIGTGVDVTDIRRQVDMGLERRIRLQLGIHGSAQIDYTRWSEIEAVFNEPDGGLSNNFTDFFGSIGKLQTQPSNRSLRGGTVQEGKSLASAMNQLARRFKDVEDSSFNEINGHARQINELAQSIAKLNDQIAASEANGSTANDLRDTRERQIQIIGELTDVSVVERASGSADVQIGGLLLVSSGKSNPLEVSRDANQKTIVTMQGSQTVVTMSGGKIEALQRHENTEIPAMLAKLDKIAKNLALEFNRVHSTGVPLDGYYEDSLSAIAVKDLNQDGTFGNDLLADSGLPFDITTGDLYIAVTDKATGGIKRTKIDIAPASMSLIDVASKLNAVANVNASVDPSGKLRVTASSGYGYDFSTRLDPDPDEIGSFGGTQPSHASSASGPFNMTVPSTLRVTIDGTNHDIGFVSGDFANTSAATVDEVVTAMNANAGFAANGVAANVGGRLVVRSNTQGATASLTMSNLLGTPLAALSLSGTTVNGQATAVNAKASGSYTGTKNGQFIFSADSSGTIGVTAGLTVSVFDSDGVKVASLDAGPNTKLLDGPVDVVDGVTLELSPGQIDQGQVFALDTLADSDTSDLLAAIGMNSFFLGSTAADLSINGNIEKNPGLLAASVFGEEGDATNLERMLNLRDTDLALLGGNSFEDFYGNIVGDVGFESSGAETLLFAEDQLLGALEAERASVSGVNLDEEMIDLVKYQQAFEAASRFINIVNELSRTLINLGR